MSSKFPYRFSFVNDSGHYYYLDNAGSLQTSSIAKYLQYAPKGWMEEEIKWTRSLTYHGLTRTYTTPYQFVGDGARILRMLYQLYGIEAICILKVERINDVDWTYDWYYEAEVDFSQYSSSGVFVKANLAESGVSKYIRGNENTTYEIPIEAVDCVNIMMDGIELEAKYRFVPIGDHILGAMGTATATRMSNAFYIKEGDYSPGAVYNQIKEPLYPFYYHNAIGSTASTNPDNCIYIAELPSENSFYIKQQFELWNDASSANDCKFWVVLIIVDSNLDVKNKVLVFESPIVVTPGNHSVTNLETTSPIFNLVKGDRVYLSLEVGQWNGGAGGFYADFIWAGNLTNNIGYEHILYTKFKLPESKIRAYRTPQVFQKLTTLMSESNYSSFSSFLSNQALNPNTNFDNVPYRTTITCGDAVRGLVKNKAGAPVDPKIRTTFSDFFKALQCLYGVGMGYDNATIIIEPIEYFYKTGVNDMIYDLGDVDNISLEPARDYLGNVLKAGFGKQDYDGLNGRDEVNNSQEYKFPMKRINKRVDMVNSYRADMYGIEYTRANMNGKETTDSESDNDNFFISINNTMTLGAFGLNRPSGTFNDALLSPTTAFNIDLTPKRCLFRNGSFIRTINYPNETGTITFQTADKNARLSCDIGSGTITENANITINTLKAKAFLPILIRIKKEIPANIIELLKNKPYGYFKFSCFGYEFKAFPFEVSVVPTTENVVEISMLPLPDTSISDLTLACNQF